MDAVDTLIDEPQKKLGELRSYAVRECLEKKGAFETLKLTAIPGVLKHDWFTQRFSDKRKHTSKASHDMSSKLYYQSFDDCLKGISTCASAKK